MNLRGMVTLKCWGSETNSFLLSSFKPIPVGPTQKQTSKHGVKMTEVTESINISDQTRDIAIQNVFRFLVREKVKSTSQSL